MKSLYLNDCVKVVAKVASFFSRMTISVVIGNIEKFSCNKNILVIRVTGIVYFTTG